jgi:hypothetical protein
MTRSFFGKGQQGPNATNRDLLYRLLTADAALTRGPTNAKASGAAAKIDSVAEALGIASAPFTSSEATPESTLPPAAGPTARPTAASYNPNLPSRLDFLRPSDLTLTHVTRAGPGWTEVQTADGQTIRREGDRNWRNNNPGNMEYGRRAKRYGAIGRDYDDRFAVFPTLEAGRIAQEKLLFSPEYAVKTLAKGIEKWAPEEENDTEKYISTVAKRAGVSRDAILSTLTPKERSAVIAEMRRYEGFHPGQQHVLGATGSFGSLGPWLDLPNRPTIPRPAIREPLTAPQGNQPDPARFAPEAMPDASQTTLPMLQWALRNTPLDEAERTAVNREIERRQGYPDLPRSGPIPPRR